MKTMTCSECGTNVNVKAAREYTELAEILDIWRMPDEMASVFLCPRCASVLVGEMSLDTVAILPLDFYEIGDPDTES